MSDHLTREYFAERLGRSFRLALDDQELQLELIEVKSLGPSAAPPPAASAWSGGEPTRQESFSLVFRGPQTPPLDQGLFELDPTEADELTLIFLVPIAADDQGRYYEAIFN
jgi:hypothetical protein